MCACVCSERHYILGGTEKCSGIEVSQAVLARPSGKGALEGE
jgi:hypothetical protein